MMMHTVTIGEQTFCPWYNDTFDIPPQIEAEKAYREAFLDGARQAAVWDFPDVDAIERAWEERRAVRQQAEVFVEATREVWYRPDHAITAARARGRVQALELARRDWWDLTDLGCDDDEEIRQKFMRPWADAVAIWASGPHNIFKPPPTPASVMTGEQWRLVVARQRGRELLFSSLDEAQAHLRAKHGPWCENWAYYDDAKQVLGYAYRWRRRLDDEVRLIARYAQQWAVFLDEKVTAPHAIVRRLAAVPREQLQWLWPGRIPLGKLTLLLGDPGLGKSFVTLDLAARVSRGSPWPDLPLLSQPVGGVILMNAEDDLADTVAPRLDRMGADDIRITAIEGVGVSDGRRHFSLKDDLPRLEEVLRANPATRLVIIDPLDAYCGHIDSHKSVEVRGALAPLAQVASQYRVAILGIQHLSKSGGTKAVYRAMGSLAFAAAARSAWMIVKDQSDPQRRLMLPVKLNVARDADGLAYRIVDGRVAWDSTPVKMHADDALAAEAAANEPGRGAERREAVVWLRARLTGSPAPASELIEAAEADGIAERTLRRAFKTLGGQSRKDGTGHWYWYLPGQDGQQDGHM